MECRYHTFCGFLFTWIVFDDELITFFCGEVWMDPFVLKKTLCCHKKDFLGIPISNFIYCSKTGEFFFTDLNLCGIHVRLQH